MNSIIEHTNQGDLHVNHVDIPPLYSHMYILAHPRHPQPFSV